MSKLIDRGPSTKGWHFHQDFLICPRLWAFNHLGDKPESPLALPLVRGILVHCGLAHHYKRLQLKAQGDDPGEYLAPVDAVRALAQREFEATENVLWHDLEEVAATLVAEYGWHYGKDEGWEVLQVEDQIEATIEDGNKSWLYTQRPDMVARRSDGKVFIWDHKCVSNLTQSGARRKLSGQFLGYRMLGTLLYGKDFGGVLMNLVGASTKKVAFKREYMASTPWSDLQFTRTIKYANRMIEGLKQQNLPAAEWPAVYTEYACFRYNKLCDHHATCTHGPGERK